MRKVLVFGISVIIILAATWFIYSMNNNLPTSNELEIKNLSIPTKNTQVEKPKAQVTNMDTSQIEAELEKLNEEDSTDLEVDDIE